MSGEKDQPPTDKKLRDARRDGEVPKSADATAACSVVATLAVLLGGSGWLGQHLQALVHAALRLAFDEDIPLEARINGLFFEGFLLMAPVAFAAMAGAIIGACLQGAITFSFKPVQLKFDSINPANGIKKVISIESAVEAVKIITKATVLGLLLWHVFKGLLPLLVNTTARSPDLVARVLWEALGKILIVSTAFLVLIGAVDFGLQRKLFTRKQRMSKDDIKREHKDSEGDPEVKHKRKEFGRELVMEDPRHAVARANAVIANPTHYAVAIRFRPDECPLPVIVAKGHDEEALMIRRWAEQCGVPVVENPPLARTLYKVPRGAVIPSETYTVVALVLKWAAAVGKPPLDDDAT